MPAVRPPSAGRELLPEARAGEETVPDLGEPTLGGGQAEAKERAGNRCEDCGRAPTEQNPLELDHVLPVSEGGGHEPGNTRVRCLRCHRAKTRRDDAKRRRGRR